MKKKYKKNKNINQSSFYFEDYLETNKKNRVLKSGGKVLLSLPYKKAFDCNQHVNYFDLEKIEKELSF